LWSHLYNFIYLEKKAAGIQCVEGCGNNATCECKNCESEFCDNCFDDVHSRAALKKHVKCALGSLSQNKPKKCKEHDKDIELVCIQCNETPICLMCPHGSHKNHDIVLMQEHVGKVKKSISVQCSELTGRIESVEKARNLIRTSIEEVLQVLVGSSGQPLFLMRFL
jgi:hypothetical protein